METCRVKEAREGGDACAPPSRDKMYFGGKSKVAPLVWARLGDVDNYVEPFFGSGAVLLTRPHPPRIETVNDLDCYVANFWRATQHDPEAVAEYADWPVNEIDLHARHRWLVGIDPPSPWTDTPYLHAMAGPGKWARARAEFRERMRADPDHLGQPGRIWQQVQEGKGERQAREAVLQPGVRQARPGAVPGLRLTS
jgi:hypothetical protein